MQELIKISPNTIGESVVQTVNARELHSYLEVRTSFKDWIARRIEDYGFQEGKDFCSSLRESSGGRPSKEYAICIDMAKELSMVERNEKGKEARRYFIACENQLMSQVQHPTNTAHPVVHATDVFKPLFEISKLIGLDNNAAAISANHATLASTGINLLHLMKQTHLLADNQQHLIYTPTELGSEMGVSAKGFNLLLVSAGLQAKVGGNWQPTEAGQQYAKVLDTGKRHGDGTPVQQVKWLSSVLDIVRPIWNSED